MIISCSRFGAPHKILPHKVRIIMKKAVNHHKIIWEELVSDLKLVGTTLTKTPSVTQYAVMD